MRCAIQNAVGSVLFVVLAAAVPAAIDSGLLAAQDAQPPQAAPLTVAVVNYETVVEGVAKNAPTFAELNRLRLALRQLLDKSKVLQAKLDTLAKEGDEAKDVQAELKSVTDAANKLRADIAPVYAKTQAASQDLWRDYHEALKTVAEEQGVDVVLRIDVKAGGRETIAYYRQRADLSGAIIKKIDAMHAAKK